jgi:serine/threonine-protein kinase PknG
VSAAFGLARCRAAAGDRRGAIDAYRAVPASSATFTEAQVASAKVLAGSTMGADQAPTHDDIAEAATTIEQARIDAAEKSRLAAEVLERALGGMQDGSVAEQASISAFGNPLTEIGIRQSLEATYRELARVAATAEERFELVDKANAVRPKSLV